MLALRHPLSLLLIACLVLFGVLRSTGTPSVVDAAAPASEFSAERALVILQDLLADGKPHPSGSPANRAVGDRIREDLTSWGYAVEEQEAFHCSPLFGACSQVRNLLAVRQGTDGRRAILLTAHYDSVPSGPGAADDGAGVAAVLEIARMSALAEPAYNDLAFLLTDGEEQGLIGAELFAASHPLFEKVAAVVNLEARGLGGPSVMFETGDGNRSIIRIYSKALDRPVANSLTHEIYKRMANDTDFSVYRDRGAIGFNFAFVGGAAGYHSSVDTITRLDPGSLQHHGDNAWALLKSLGERDLLHLKSRENAGYIDLFAWRLIHYPAAITGGLAMVLSVWVLIAVGIAFRRDFRYHQLRWGLLALPALCAAIIAGAWLLSWPLGHLREMHPLEHPYPWPGRLALFSWVLCALYGALLLFRGRVSPCAWMILGWAAFGALSLYLSATIPEASHIALVPLAAFALGSLVDLVRPRSRAPLLVSTVLGYAAAAYIGFYHFFLLDVVVNFDGLHLKAIPLCLAALVVMPMLLAWLGDRDIDWKLAGLLAGSVVLFTLVHLLMPGFTDDRPRPMGLSYLEGDGPGVGFLALEDPLGLADRGYAKSHGFKRREVDVSLAPGRQRYVLDVARQELPALEVLEAGVNAQGQRELALQVPDGAEHLTLELPDTSGLRRAWVNGQLALDRTLPTRHTIGPRVRISWPPAGAMSMSFETESSGEVTLRAETRFALPGELTSTLFANWPADAQPLDVGPSGRKTQVITLPAQP